MNYIEELLFEKTKDFQEAQVYSDQWKFAKSYLPKVLDTISHIFPHYSLHNSTHSEAIINNIIKILGTDNIRTLSVVDLWLLLAAAYYHDCGMAVSGDDKKELFEDGSEFVRYVEEKQQDQSSPMNQYAVLFEIKGNKIYYKSERLTNDSYEGARFLIADYIRNKHAERSGVKIENEGSLHFPGDPIPERIIRILKSICGCHTRDVSEVMQLHAVESSGCGIEDCHPRFIAAMLRLGDLLDVDSNRVSEVLLSTLGSIPSDSKFYNSTNRAISHIRIDKSIIEITAECNDYNVADLINRWFQWLNDELVFYMKHWHKIIPNEKFGYLPTVGDLKVNLSNYDTFDGKKRPSFDIDSSKAIELLQGAGLYTDSCECIRELLQNSVDATYLRVYKENLGINDIKSLKDACEHYPITVQLQKLDTQSTDNKYTLWGCEITDHGIGMTKDDIKFLSTTGSSGKNKEKIQLIKSVPEFLRPSGTFGIGFQSVFLITNKIKVISRKINKDYYVEAEMYNPSGKERGAILIKTINKDDVDFGTKLYFEFQDENEGHQIFGYEDRYSMSAFNSFDFAKNKYVNLIGMKILDEIVRFANGTFMPVNFIYNGDKKNYVSSKTKIKFDDVDEETGLQLCIDKTSGERGVSYLDSMVYYRNQWVRNYIPSIPYLTFHINILKGSAKDILTLSRNQIRRKHVPILKECILKATIKYLNKKFDSLDTIKKQLASMYLEEYRDYIFEKQINDIIYRDNWKKYEFNVKEKTTDTSEKWTIEKLLESTSIEYIRKEDEVDQLQFNSNGSLYIIKIEYELRRICYFLLRMAQSTYHLSFKKGGYILYKDNKCNLIEDSRESKEDLMYNYLRRDERARELIPCNEKYKVLQIKKKIFSEYQNLEWYLEYPCMICPYIRKYDIEHVSEAICLEYNVDKTVINTVFENRYDEAVTKKQIEEAYLEYKKEWDPIIEKVNSKAKRESINMRSYMCRSYRISL